MVLIYNVNLITLYIWIKIIIMGTRWWVFFNYSLEKYLYIFFLLRYYTRNGQLVATIILSYLGLPHVSGISDWPLLL